MPHKHTRRGVDNSVVDLPPTLLARPLPTAPAPKNTPRRQTSTTKPSAAAAAAAPVSQGTKRKREARATASVRASTKTDDAPRAFKRLMAMAGGRRVRSGLDDGKVETKKEKKKRLAEARARAAGEGGPDKEGEAEAGETAADAKDAEGLTIRPGERMSDFARRVDAALPLSGLVAKAKPGAQQDPLGLARPFRTRQERKLHKLYDQWREEDRRRKERLAEQQELAEEAEMELDETLGVKWRVDAAEKTGKKGKKKNGGGGGGDDDDVWAAFNRQKGAATKSTVRAGIHGVVGEPPALTKINASKFKFAQKLRQARDGAAAAAAAAAADLPHTVDPADRDDVAAARQDVLASYRRLAAARRGATEPL